MPSLARLHYSDCPDLPGGWSLVPVRTDAVAAVEAILSRPETELDYAETKLALDAIVDPALDADTARIELERLTDTARSLVGADASTHERLAALRRLIYQAGPWNDHRPFAYDHDDPLGEAIPNKLLANYLATRRGNCISMPVLFLILAERLGLDVALAVAPLHMFVRHREDSGRVINLETTSGANPARDEWLRAGFPMTDLALKNGLYLRALPRGEAVASMASTVMEHLLGAGRPAEAIGVSAAILRHARRDVYAMVKQASACGLLLETEFVSKYAAPFLIPPTLRPRYAMLAARNKALFEAAEALGWEETECGRPPPANDTIQNERPTGKGS